MSDFKRIRHKWSVGHPLPMLFELFDCFKNMTGRWRNQFFMSILVKLYYFYICEGLVRFFTYVRIWYWFFTFVKIEYQFFTGVKNWYRFFTFVKIEYQFFTYEKNRTSPSQVARIRTNSSQLKWERCEIWAQMLDPQNYRNWPYANLTFSKSDVLVPILHTVWNLRNVKFAVQHS